MNPQDQFSFDGAGQCKPMEASQHRPSVRLEIRGMGNVPSFKNSKMILGIRPVPGNEKLWRGTPFIATNFQRKEFMEKVIQSFVSQLTSIMETTSPEILMGQSPQSWIASLLPEDDSWEWIRNSVKSCRKVEPGEEGATIIIERIK